MAKRRQRGNVLAALVGVVLLANCQFEREGVRDKDAAARPGPAVAEDVEPLGPVEFYFISETGPVNLNELDERQLTELRERLVPEKGLAGSVARLALEPCPGESGLGKILWKRVIYHVNLEYKVAFFDVSTERECHGETTVKRWVVTVAGGGPDDQLAVKQMNHPNPAKPHKYKLTAGGSAIHLIAHYENGVLVQDPSLYTSTLESCIDVFFIDEPLPTAVLEYDSAVDGAIDTTGTCFGKCGPPGIVATM